MKLPSIQSLIKYLIHTVIRFPTLILTLVLAVILSYSFVYLNSNTSYSNSINQKIANYATGIALCNFAFVFGLGLDLFAERSHWSQIKKWLARIMVLLIGLLLYFILEPVHYQTDFFKIILLISSAHFFVAVSPFLIKGQQHGFWQYNKTLFLRFLTSALYSVVLFIGLVLALLTIHNLFSIKIEEEIYGYLAVTLFVGFNSLFFLVGVPEDWQALNKKTDYPKGLKVFTQFVLMPLIVVYICILLGYESKIAYEWVLPNGYVSLMIIALGVCGLLSILLVFPIRDLPENKWIRLYTKIYNITMVPILVLLWLAVFRRMNDYGWTEPRYILLVLSIWLTIVTFYFIFSKNENIKLLPASLAVIAILIAFGPLSLTQISKKSQLKRLQKMLVVENKKDVDTLRDQIIYLYEMYGYKPLQPYFKTNLKQLSHHYGEKDKFTFASKVIASMAIDTNIIKADEIINTSFFEFNSHGPYKTDGYDNALVLSYIYNNKGDTFKVDNKNITYNHTKNNLIFYEDNNSVLSVNLDSVNIHLRQKYAHVDSVYELIKYIPADDLTITSADGNYRFCFFSFNSEDSFQLDHTEVRGGMLLLK